MRRTVLVSVAVAFAWACDSPSTPTPATPNAHSGSLALSRSGATLYVAHPDADEVSVLDMSARRLTVDILLGSAAPQMDSKTNRFDPAVSPRAVTLDSSGATLYVTGQRSGKLYAVDTASNTVRASVAVCSEPVGVLVSADDNDVFVACSQDDAIADVNAQTLTVSATIATPRKPWALAWAPDGKTLLATHLLGPGISTLATSPLALTTTWTVPDRGPETDPTEPHGQVRGLYDLAVRPGTSELWTLHLMLGTDTPQPTLDFENTVFPAVSILDSTSGAQLARLSVEGSNVSAGASDNGAFGDIVSGPRATAFSADGAYAVVVDTDSEDLLLIDATARTEIGVVRPLPGHMPEGVVWFGDEIYVEERNTEDVVAFKVMHDGSNPRLVQDGDPVKSITTDPMPSQMRLGQKLFYSANSDDVPTTQNHWVACASCHVEGRSDAVTWLFAQGPRDTPSNAGGMLDTGFLFRTADRNQVQDYWRTIDTEQGGFFQRGGEQDGLLDALAAYVNYALPAPVPPSFDEKHAVTGAPLTALRTQGAKVFNQLGCATCHAGSAGTDSGMGNALLDLGGPIVSTMTTSGVLLHDVGTCVTEGPWPDVTHADIKGDPRPSCAFDTPALRGLVDSAPYLHDGSAKTLEDILPVMLRAAAGGSANPAVLSSTDQTALIEYLRSL